MTEPKQKTKKISRRDAIKLIGAVTGATVLANLPSKWSTPEIAKGVLPAHAQTSSLGLTILSCNFTLDISTGAWSSTPNVGPMPIPNISIPMQFTITFTGTHFAGSADPQNPNPYINNWNLDPTTGTVLYANNSNIALSNAGNMLPDADALAGEVTILWEFLSPSQGTGTCSQTFNWALPTVDTISVNDQSPTSSLMDFSGEVISDGGSPVTARGFVWSTTPNPTLANNVVPDGSGIGIFSETVDVSPNGGVTIHVRAYATNAAGTAYGDNLSGVNAICLAGGMLVTLADGRTKKIEDIEFLDNLLVWNFDEGKFDSAQPLWIKKAETIDQYNLLEFSDGSFLKTINQHRIFNKEMGAFTYPMTEDTPIGTTTFNVQGEEVKLVNKSVVQEQVNYYNVITDKHMNLFANSILTSCRYNNIYPIVDMKFVKDNRALRSQAEYNLEEKYYEGLRLAEQTIPVADTINYVIRLKAYELETELVTV